MCMEVGKAEKLSEVIGHERVYPKNSIPPQDLVVPQFCHFDFIILLIQTFLQVL